ncbi:MAG: hypothetical protein EA355_05155 [Rhodobacteraceae bacterium]|nr:MAG: hypothetical protein EA355_05155 [Paracoccaceae bacterium]
MTDGPPQPRAFTDYDASLRVAWEEEIEGEAYFLRLAEAHDGRAAEALTLLAEIEAVTARALAPALRRRCVPMADLDALRARGRAAAEPLAGMAWPDLAAWMAENFAPFIAEFEALEALGPPEDAEALRVATDHERAAVAFAAAEAAGDPDSFRPLRDFLAQTAAP